MKVENNRIEDILRERYKVLLDDERKKKPKGSKEEDYMIFHNFLCEEEGLGKRYLGLETYLRHGREENEGLEDLGSSISLLSKYLIKPNKGDSILEKKIHSIEDLY